MVISTKLKCKSATTKSQKADISSISPSSQRRALCSGEGPMIKTSALQLPTAANSQPQPSWYHQTTLSPLSTQHHSFFRIYPLYSWYRHWYNCNLRKQRPQRTFSPFLLKVCLSFFSLVSNSKKCNDSRVFSQYSNKQDFCFVSLFFFFFLQWK